MIYARIGLQYRSFIVFFEGLALACGLGRRAWKKHRAMDDIRDIQDHIVPHPLCWQFITHDLRAAIWIGPHPADQ